MRELRSVGSGEPLCRSTAAPIKALSDHEVSALLDGHGSGFAKAAELNGYPGPTHVLDLADRSS